VAGIAACSATQRLHMTAGPVDLPRLLLAGLLGAGCMSIAGLLPRLVDWPGVDMGQIIAAKMTRVSIRRDTRLGIVAHLLVGAFLAIVYGLAFYPFIPMLPWLRGAVFGALVWLVVMIAVLPAVGDGLFGRKISAWLAPVTLVMHLVYGAVVGAVYQ
jgi:hypothetical protein